MRYIALTFVLICINLAGSQPQPRPGQGGRIPGNGVPSNGQGSSFRVPNNGMSSLDQSSSFRVPNNVISGTGQGSNFRVPNNNGISGTGPSGGIRFNTDTGTDTPGQPGRPNNNPACATTGRSAVTQCFQSNGGFQMQFVINLLSNGTQGQMPQNPPQMRRALCNAQGNIIACVFSGVNSLRNSQQCPTMTAFVRLEQETVTLISELQQICGNGPLPPPSPCLKDLTNNLRQCYSKVGLNPELFVPSDSQLIADIIGANEQVAKKFCRVKNRLYDCMQKTMNRCQGSTEVMAMGGYDHESLKKGIDVLCKDVNVYVKGVECFRQPTEQTKNCANYMVQKVTDLKMQRIQTSMPSDQYHKRYCQIRVQHLECDIAAWMKKCELDEVGLKNELECNLLPSRCRNDRAFKGRLQQTCSVASFQRQLRNSASSSRTFSAIFMTIITVVAVILS